MNKNEKKVENKQIAIDVNHVTKKFKVYYDRPNTLKEKLVFLRKNKREEKLVLNDVSLKIEKGESVALIGLNGCGKVWGPLFWSQEDLSSLAHSSAPPWSGVPGISRVLASLNHKLIMSRRLPPLWMFKPYSLSFWQP